MFKHKLLMRALVHEFPGQPGFSVTGGELRSWPETALGAFPSESQQQTWVTTYIALAADHPSKDIRADRRKRINTISPGNSAAAITDIKKILLELV